MLCLTDVKGFFTFIVYGAVYVSMFYFVVCQRFVFKKTLVKFNKKRFLNNITFLL